MIETLQNQKKNTRHPKKTLVQNCIFLVLGTTQIYYLYLNNIFISLKLKWKIQLHIQQSKNQLYNLLSKDSKETMDAQT